MSVAAEYLEATVTMAAVAREVGVDALVNMSQMTVSQMNIENTTPSRQQRQHWLGEQALTWSGLPVVTIRPTMFLDSFVPLAAATVRDGGRIELPFGQGKTSPVAAADVARVVAAVLADPGPHLGRILRAYRSAVAGHARGGPGILGRAEPRDHLLRHPPWGLGAGAETAGVPGYLAGHLVTMGELHRAGRYDRLADGVERVTGQPAMSVRDFVSLHAEEFGGRRS